MQRYIYQHGDKPLEGYTIQRAAGRGGFGEVYYALSDSGREVALKAVQNYEQVELRGITQCMNLKSPHLVTIFDVKYNDRGQPFVIMEYVSGPSLRTLLAETPGGLGTQKAAFFLREIAKGLSYLHECGIVHRDLKPGNIFYENGYVKVGDYGLTKAISATRHSGHTITVGTVHYMAPEIWEGKYNYSIDIYALGVLLYEMLTGEVPFAGASPAEILMKHMTAAPEMDKIEEPFAHVIKKALAKDPNDRYQSVQEMVEELFGEENIRNSVSHFAPEELSIVAERIAQKAKIGDAPQVKAPKAAVETPNADNQFARTAKDVYERIDRIGRNVVDRVDAGVGKLLTDNKTKIPGITDPIQPAQRYFLAFIAMVIVSIGAGFLQSHDGTNIMETAFGVFVMTGVCAGTILFIQRRWFMNIEPESKWIEKLVICCAASFLAAFISLVILNFQSFIYGNIRFFKPLFLPLFLSLFFVDWRRISIPDRQKRLSLGTALWAGLLGAISGAIFMGTPFVIAAVMAGTVLAIQAVSSFGQDIQAQAGYVQSKKRKTRFQNSLEHYVVPKFLREIFLVGSFIALGIGLFLLISAGVGPLRGDEFALAVSFGINSLILSGFFFVGFCRRKFTGWYRYIVKPVILLICVFIIIYASVVMGCMDLNGDEFALALFLIIFPALVFILVTLIPARAIVGSVPKPSAKVVPPSPPPPPRVPTPQAAPGVSAYKRTWALLFCAGGLFGLPGLQRFYVGKIGTGILWFFTGGLFLVGQIIDVIMILTGSFTDRYGLPLLIWNNKEELSSLEARPSPPEIPNMKQNLHTEAVEAIEKPTADYKPATAEVAQRQPVSNAPTTVVIREAFHPFAFLCSGVSFILIVLAIILGIIVGLQAPYFIAAGWPKQQLASELERFFGYSSWPVLLMRLGTMFTYIFLLLAAVFNILGRRHLGARHLIRALLGFLALILAFAAFSEASSRLYYNDIVNLLNTEQFGPAIERLLQSWQNDMAFTALILFLVSIVILAWPAKRNQTVISPAQISGNPEPSRKEAVS